MTETQTGPVISRRSSTVAATLFGIGVLSGLPFYLAAGDRTARPVAGTSEWPVFLGLTAAMAVWGLFAVRRSGPGILLTPFGRRAAARLRRTGREGGLLRRGAVGFLLLLNGYDLWRAGVQVIAGLDPDFVTNAWGGPSYLGAMYCHYLVAGVIGAVSAVLLDRLLLHDRGGISA